MTKMQTRSLKGKQLDRRLRYFFNNSARLVISEIPQNITRSVTRQLTSIGITIPTTTLPTRTRQIPARIQSRRKLKLIQPRLFCLCVHFSIINTNRLSAISIEFEL